MGIHFLANITKRGLITLNSGAMIRSQFIQNQQQCRPYGYNFLKSKSPKQFQPSNPRRWCSSTSNKNKNKNAGLLAWYLGLLQSRPIITKCVSSATIYGVADLTSQAITKEPSSSFDIVRTIRVAGYGLLFLGGTQHVWYNFLGRILPKQDVKSTLKKMALGQLSYGPFVTGVFFAYNAGLQGESVYEIAARLKRDLIPTIVNGLVYWPMCDFITYKVIPVHLQPLWNSSFSYLWTIYLTHVGSLKKAVVD